MRVYQAILKRRTIRLFKDKRISKRILKKLVNAARLAPSAKNLQPLEYLVVNDKKLCEKIFENVYFGGETERLRTEKNKPVAYILVLTNKKVAQKFSKYDAGLAVENIVLTALEEGIGCCIMGAIKREKLKKICKIPSNYHLDLVLAFGYPAEKPVLEKGHRKYWRDKRGILHVPKRSLKEILHWNKF